jgi:hypothetical protein
MNKFCKSSQCVEKICESYVLVGRVLEVPGVEDAISISVKLRRAGSRAAFVTVLDPCDTSLEPRVIDSAPAYSAPSAC